MFDLSAYQSGFPIESATYTLQVQDPLDRHDQVVTEVAWTGYNDLIVKETNRAATRERTVHFNLSNIATEGLQLGAVIRDIDYAEMDGGWVPAGQRITSLVQRQSSSSSTGKLGIPDDLPEGYLDVIPGAQGFMHLALFSPSDAKEPVFLTSGEWDIDQTVKAIDTIRRQAYFIAARPSTERHLYSVSIPTQQQLQAYRAGKGKLDAPKNMTDASSPGFHDVSFSPEAGYYLLGQRSGIPWQKILKVEDPGELYMKRMQKMSSET